MTRTSRFPVFAIICILVSAVIGYAIYGMPQPSAFQQMSARVWPAILVVTLFLAALVLILEARTERQGASALAEDDEEEFADGYGGWIYLAVFAGAAVLVHLLGYIITCAILILSIGALMETRARMYRIALAAVLIPAAIYYLFTSVAGQYLPMGVLLEGFIAS